MTGDTLDNHDALFHALVSQHGAAHHIANGIDIRRICRTQIVDVQKASFIQVHTRICCQQSLGIGPTPYCNNKLVNFNSVVTVFVLIGHADVFAFASALDLGARHARAHANIEALLGQNPLGIARNSVICDGQKFVHGFKHNDFRAEPVPHAA